MLRIWCLLFGWRSALSTTPANREAVQQRESPEKKAQSLLDALPGNSLLTKTGYLTVGTSLATYLVSKEIYVLNEESVALIATVGLLAVLYRTAREPYTEFAEGYINNMINIFKEARKEHKAAVQSRIDQVAELKDVVDVTKNMFQMSKELAQMESQIFELKQRVAYAAEAKSVLDSWVRHEANIREREQKELATSVIEKSRQELMKPEVVSIS
ncbi:atp4 subunit B of the stator stalk of mitochondrial F1F0 ATP synthase [Tieghemiomyces parasiticus]|uniref:ATP synthase subunit 4 n=1 Tax=Tieghemiomyces parasiticus TaxID=78921 RepID=A0A9W8AD33_9FUNG|nr:atp4 subunit B of the stator stalk of mitochondrial F1F0 ATP synthase [Tieghemiomyces parasiticus]